MITVFPYLANLAANLVPSDSFFGKVLDLVAGSWTAKGAGSLAKPS